GAGELEKIETLVPQTIWLSFFISLVVYLVTSQLAREIFSLYSARGLILDYSVDYFRIRAFGFPFTLVTFAIFGVLRGMQNTFYAMCISIGGGLLNIALDIIMVFGVEGIVPPMGIEGAAWASLTAQFFMTAVSIWLLLRRTPFGLKLSLRAHPELRSIISMSANLVVRTAALNVAFYLANRYATGYGESHIAAHTIALNVWIFSAFFIDGYANAGIAIAGKLLGAKNHVALGQLGKDLGRYSMMVALGVVVFFLAAYPFIGRLFTAQKGVLELFGGVFWMIILIQPVNALAFAFDGIFKGLGRARLLRNVLLASTFGGFVPTLVVCDYLGMGLHGIWTAFIVWMAVRSGTLIWVFSKDYLQKTGE
ncbi:MATE family efflux transporter, partial [Myxococcota bacterium]|nr:MATE family efflux transporter [Myxococcota bacterium]